MSPLGSSIHIDKALEQVSVAFKPEGLIGDMFPVVPVKHDSDKYFVYSKDNMSIPETLRAAGAEANEADWSLSTASYRLEKHALKHLVEDDDRKNADKAIKPDVDAVEMLTLKIQLQKEKAIADLVGTGANWANSQSLSSTQAWSANTTLSNPITLLDSAASAVLSSCGRDPNVLILDDSTFKAAKEHVSIVDRVKYTSSDSVSESMLAKLFNIQKLWHPKGVFNTAEEGLADSLSFLWTDMAFLAHMEFSPGLKKPSAIYQFVQKETGSPFKVKKWREEKREGDMIEVGSKYQYKPVASDCAFIVINTVQ